MLGQMAVYGATLSYNGDAFMLSGLVSAGTHYPMLISLYDVVQPSPFVMFLFYLSLFTVYQRPFVAHIHVDIIIRSFEILTT